MNLVALLLTYLLFCHPVFLAALCVIVAIIMLFVYFPLGMTLFGIILVGWLLYNAFIK